MDARSETRVALASFQFLWSVSDVSTQLGMIRTATSEDFPGTEFSTVVVSRT